MTRLRPDTWLSRALERFRQVWRDRLSLLALLRGEGGVFAVLLVLHALTALWPSATAVSTGWLAARLGQVLTDGRPVSDAAVPLALLGVLILLEEATVSLRDTLQLAAAGRVDNRVRGRVRALVLAPRDSAHLDAPAIADDISRAGNITGGGHRSPGKAATGQLLLLSRFATAAVAAVLLSHFSVVLALALLLASLLMRAVVRRQWMHLAAVKDSREDRLRRVRYWSETAGGPAAAKEIRLFGLNRWVVARRTREALEWAEEIWRTRRAILKHQWAAILISLGCGIAALLFPALSVVRGDTAVAELVTYLVAGVAVLQISSMGYEAFDIEHGLDSVRALKRLERRADLSPTPAAGPDLRAPSGQRPPKICVENLTFTYPGATRPVIDGLDLNIGSGEVVAVIGGSGVGKTTLVKLLAGLYRPDSGRLAVDGVDLEETDIDAWRRRIGVVFQDFNRYPLTAADNVSLGAPEAPATPEAVAAALTRGDASDLVDGLIDGPQTVVAGGRPGGVDLSGGQWQRLAIARAMYAAAHGRDVLVFDEPTANLDVQAETEFYRRVVAQASGRTVILISHRLSTVRHAHRIVLLEGGRVAEEGSHDELMAASGRYAHLFLLQAARFTSAGDPDHKAPSVR